MDAVDWTDWRPAVDPWTTWKAPWYEWGIHVVPPKEHCGTKNTFPRRMLERFLKVFQLKPSTQPPKTRPYVSALCRTLPSNRPRPAGHRSPTAVEGGFIEHLDHNPRYRAMLENVRRGRSVNFLTSEGIVGTQNVAGDTGGPQVDNDEGDVPGEGEGGRRKRDKLRKTIRDALGTCAAPVAPRPRKRLSKTRIGDTAEESPLLEKTEDRQPSTASGDVQAS